MYTFTHGRAHYVYGTTTDPMVFSTSVRRDQFIWLNVYNDFCMSAIKVTILLDAEAKALVDKQPRSFNLSEQVRNWIKAELRGTPHDTRDSAAH